MDSTNQLFSNTRLRGKKTEKLEKDVQAQILEYLRAEDRVYVIKVHSTSKSGVADVIACIGGVFVTFEIKRAKGKKATPLQLYNAEQVRMAGGLAYVVYDLTIVTMIVAGIKSYLSRIEFDINKI